MSITIFFFSINIALFKIFVNNFQVCWSPKGKQLAVCTKQKNLLLLNHDLDIKSNYECLDNGLTRKSFDFRRTDSIVLLFKQNVIKFLKQQTYYGLLKSSF